MYQCDVAVITYSSYRSLLSGPGVSINTSISCGLAKCVTAVIKLIAEDKAWVNKFILLLHTLTGYNYYVALIHIL